MAVVAGVPRPRFGAHMWLPLAGGIAGVGAVVGSRAGVMHGPRTLGVCLEREEAGARVMWALPPRGACSALSVDLARNGRCAGHADLRLRRPWQFEHRRARWTSRKGGGVGASNYGSSRPY